MMRISLKDWCIENSRTELLEQWDYDKNAMLGLNDLATQFPKIAEEWYSTKKQAFNTL